MHTDDIVRIKQVFDQIGYEGYFDLLHAPTNLPGSPYIAVEFQKDVNGVNVIMRVPVVDENPPW
jgi:hypothetical protein